MTGVLRSNNGKDELKHFRQGEGGNRCGGGDCMLLSELLDAAELNLSASNQQGSTPRWDGATLMVYLNYHKSWLGMLTYDYIPKKLLAIHHAAFEILDDGTGWDRHGLNLVFVQAASAIDLLGFSVFFGGGAF